MSPCTRRGALQRLPHRPLRRQFTVALCVGAALAALSSCGLPSATTGLAAPTQTVSDPNSAHYFGFASTPPDPTYTLLGFELYYKIYDPNQVLQQYTSDTTQFDPLKQPAPGTSALTAIGYTRLVAYDPGDPSINYLPNTFFLSTPTALLQSSAPAVPITATDQAEPFTIQIAMPNYASYSPPSSINTTQYSPALASSTLTGTSLSFRSGSTVLVLARLITQPTNSYSSTERALKGFGANDFSASDSDLPTTLASAPGSTLGIGVGLIVLAYGLDPSLSTVYSVPVPLGYVSLDNVTINTTTITSTQ